MGFSARLIRHLQDCRHKGLQISSFDAACSSDVTHLAADLSAALMESHTQSYIFMCIPAVERGLWLRCLP